MTELFGFLGDIEINHLYYLAILLPFVLLLFSVFRREKAAQYGDQKFTREHRFQFDRRQRIILAAIPLLIVIVSAGLILGPRLKTTVHERAGEPSFEGRDIMAVVDVSGSMSIFSDEDGKKNVEIARDTLADFIGKRKWDRIGLLLFDMNPYLARPFLGPKDHALLLQDTIGDKGGLDFITALMGGGTEIAKALDTAVSFFDKASQAKSKVIILITDLEDSPDTVAGAITRARERNILVYILGVKVGSTWSDNLMPQFSNDPGVRFFNVQNEKEMASAYNLIDALESSLFAFEKEAVYRKSLAPYLAVGNLGLIMILVFLLDTVFRKIP